MSSIPVLKMEGQWLSDAKEKADAFAQTFAVKGELPAEVVDTPFFGESESEFKGFVAFRSRHTKRLFKKLDESKATGHDQISAVILRRLADCLAMPFTKVCGRLFFGACWPTIWKYHLIVPIFKKGSAFQPGNYRGVHLTTILSKVAEKMIAHHLVPFLHETSFGKKTNGLSPAA